MSVESHLRESILQTALLHLLRNQKKSPDRTARNIQELLLRFNPSESAEVLPYEELLKRIKSCSREEFINWIMSHLS